MSARLVETPFAETLATRLRSSATAECEFYWLGQAGFVIEGAGRRIAIDPYLSNTLAAKADESMDAGQTDVAITNYRAALAQYTQNLRASEGLSNALTAKGLSAAGDTNNESAIVYFDEAIKFDKQNDVAYAKLGDIYRANGHPEKAVPNYERAVQLNPAYTELNLSLIHI